jgi:hypothetical protein
MRKMESLLVAALLLASVVVLTDTGAGAATPISCKTASGHATFSPALPKSSDRHKVHAAFSMTGHLGSCSGGRTSASVTLKQPKSKAGLNCKTWLTYNGRAKPTSATEVITWNGGVRSNLTVALRQVRGKPTQRRITGTIANGPFRGYRMAGTVTFTLPKNACKTTTLSSMSYHQGSVTTFTPPVTPPPPPPGPRSVPRNLSG